MTPVHVTLEPNEENSDAVALTLLCPSGTTVEQAARWVVTNDPSVGGLGVDIHDQFFCVLKTKDQPVSGLVRFQAHPTC